LDSQIQIQAYETRKESFKITLPFLNPRERFEILVYFDGEKDECVLDCRMPDVRAKTRKIDDVAGVASRIADAALPAFGGLIASSLVTAFFRASSRRWPGRS